jgi:hypothetical protein
VPNHPFLYKYDFTSRYILANNHRPHQAFFENSERNRQPMAYGRVPSGMMRNATPAFRIRSVMSDGPPRSHGSVTAAGYLSHNEGTTETAAVKSNCSSNKEQYCAMALEQDSLHCSAPVIQVLERVLVLKNKLTNNSVC